MFKANVGSSTNADAKAAGREAGASAAQGLEDVKVAFVYGSCEYDTDQMLAGVAEALPGVPLLGNTSFTGVITPAGYIASDGGFCGVMAFAGDLTVGVAGAARSDADCACIDGIAIAQAAQKAAGKTGAPDYFYMAAAPAEEESYLKGISKVIGRMPFFGGSAADNTISGDWQLYTDAGSFPNGCIVAFFYDAPQMENLFTGAFKETDNFGVITKVEGKRTLAEIDGVPALKKYQEWTGYTDDQVMGGALLDNAVCKPIGVKDRLGDLVAIRHPMNGNDDWTIACGNDLAEKTCVIQMEASVDELIDSTGDTLKALIEQAPFKPTAFHLVHCGGRRAAIDARIGEVADQIKAAAGDIPFIVEFTFGEYGSVSDNNNTCGGLMLSFTAFGE